MNYHTGRDANSEQQHQEEAKIENPFQLRKKTNELIILKDADFFCVQQDRSQMQNVLYQT